VVRLPEGAATMTNHVLRPPSSLIRPSSDEVKNAWSFNYCSPYALMAWCLDVDNFTFKVHQFLLGTFFDMVYFIKYKWKIIHV
jgi:hypothetical protein